MKNLDSIIGVDLGGTNIRAGKVVGQQIKKATKAATPSAGTEAEVLETLFSVIDGCFDENIKSIGVGVPSVVDIEKGIVYDVANIPSWKVVPLKEILEARYRVKVYVNNDANCFALGEKYFGKAQQYSSVVGLTIGTGLGSGLIFNGNLYEGINCGAGEVGCFPYLDGILENYCSGQFFADKKSVTAVEAFKLAESGDQAALRMFVEFGYHMGQAIKTVLYAYDPAIIILGGSLTKAYGLFRTAMFESIQDFPYRNVLTNLKIEVSELEHSAIYGSAALYLNKNKRSS